jgi:hypothetical protein
MKIILAIVWSKFTEQLKTCKMKHPLPLKRFEYCFPEPGATANDAGIGGSDFPELHFRLANVEIDFEKKNLSLERERIKVRATLYSGHSMDLSNTEAGELIFSLAGIMEDGNSISSCSGLLVLDSLTNRNEAGGREWHASVYLYDDCDDEKEIMLRLTMYCLSGNAELN